MAFERVARVAHEVERTYWEQIDVSLGAPAWADLAAEDKAAETARVHDVVVMPDAPPSGVGDALFRVVVKTMTATGSVS